MKNHWRKLFSLMPDKLERKLYQQYFKGEHKRLSTNNPFGYASNWTKQQVLKQIKKQYEVHTFER